MATLTATTYSQPPRSMPSGVISVSGSFALGDTKTEVSAQTIFLCKIPNKATILDIIEHHTTGATSCPMDFGIDATLSAFVTQGTQGVVNRGSVGQNLPYTVSLSDDAANNFATLKATPSAATATTSFKCNWSVLYTMDK